MEKLQELRLRIDQVMNNLEIPAKPKNLYQPISYTLANSGKRMRPLLVLLGCKVFSESIENAIHPAIGLELFHNFTLLHDDIMDDAPLRRGKPTVHRKWNTNIAILSGDAMMIQAYQHVLETKQDVLVTVLRIFNTTALEVCDGQQLDMDFEEMERVSINDYLNMIRLKTAVLLAACLKVGATVGGANEEQAQLLYDFGLNTGIAFQLQDDILDVYGESNKVGKQKGGDIISNKKTFLLLKAMELAEGNDASELSRLLKSDDAEKVDAVIRIYDKLNIRELAEQRMWQFYNSGIESLEKVNGNQEWISTLKGFTHALMHREH
ncbi:MAG: polyprenyl synthetase family protein [Flavobacteriales bacterium]|nr:polyprenyl synthetase family protein [Flavobacteriales bacterium]